MSCSPILVSEATSSVLSENHSTDDAIVAPPLDELQSKEQGELIDLVVRLRRAGLSSVLQLPQIVVCGDQSSGKSSVLEAVTEIPFPRKENLCTRFATEISMRTDSNSTISCKINPHDDDRSEDAKDRLRAFARTIVNIGQLPTIIDEATKLMGLDERHAFSRDVLKIEICGPTRPQLTLVDLPGLIHSANKSQSDEDVQLIKSLVDEFISEERTIILAVISAKNDYANQVILDRCQKVDPSGARTLGVITKPDFLRPGSENQKKWLNLAQNQDIYFKLGWHMLRNRDDDQHAFSADERDMQETIFFDAGNYRMIPTQNKGIVSFRQRLSTLLYQHLRDQLPGLKHELDELATQTLEKLESLGKSRSTLPDRKFYLMEMFTNGRNLLDMGVRGMYESTFFETASQSPRTKKGKKSHVWNERKLRSMVQNTNIYFAKSMHENGHKFRILDDGAETDGDEASGDIKTHSQAISWVLKTLKEGRGRELPGTFNPMLVWQLFWKQSETWEQQAKAHVIHISEVCMHFVHLVLDHVAASDVKRKILDKSINPALVNSRDAALSELKKVVDDKNRHPITYNHYFTDTLQKRRQERLTKRLTENIENATVSVTEKTFMAGPGYEERSYINPAVLKSALQETTKPDMDEVSAEEALDAMKAYYKDELKYFINAITKQVIERHLVAPLAEIMSPVVIVTFTDKEIMQITEEPKDIASLREHLQSKMSILTEGQEAFRQTMWEF
ncbi:hypothetical protein P152DRAFT_489969 [Eremomyces bilateralis CBS 781.70]|uniref:Dynamin family protein n=1 Tax=Eremomyces bilateralis CBS 781.70 TaxID=1392243 RepID=A0A6G1FZ47_9PEZI|nr:uncharacterized protein P152DRAFT_489969 [Eremomyces bilateralis CBS 781.70]KAF1810946.1 hypothetical protein P152DRAFT_489969 [Eremomyces bilateralis CBS 781.70]